MNLNHLAQFLSVCLVCCPSQPISTWNSSSSWHRPSCIAACRTPAFSDETFNTLLGPYTENERASQSKGERGLPDDRQERWILASKIRYFEVLEFPSLIMYFLADILFVVITVVRFGIVSVLQSKESLLKELATNSVFVCDGHLRATPKQGDTNCIHLGLLY